MLRHLLNHSQPNYPDPGKHLLNIVGINSSRDREQRFHKIDISSTGLSNILSTISIRVYDDKSKDYINRITTSFLKTILTAANYPLDQDREPEWAAVCKALKGVTFDATVKAKEGGVPYLTSLKVASDIRTGDPWGAGPEEAERLRAFLLDDQDYL